MADLKELVDFDGLVDVVEEERVWTSSTGTSGDEGDVVGEAEGPGFSIDGELDGCVIKLRS